MNSKQIHHFNSIAEFHKMSGLPRPDHPLVSLVDYGLVDYQTDESEISWMQDFYSVGLKRNIQGKFKYGQQQYDFDEGLMTFVAPKQVVSITIDKNQTVKPTGLLLFIHPDFLWNSQLAKTISKYEFFGYNVNEALFMSEKEELVITDILKNIQREYHSAIDKFTQNIIVAQIEQLLGYCERFYQRQFITRAKANHRILAKVEDLLDSYFNSDDLIEKGPPTAQYLAEQLYLSPNYLGSLLKSLTGHSTQTHIHEKLIEKAIEGGGQVLFLLPEIALTTQIVERIKLYFGDKIGVYHSKFNDNERVEIWNKVLNGAYQVVLGARSAVFLPFGDLKLIVVDEEHESSYKQHEPAPRYQARDAAVFLGHLHQAKVVLGSATPSIESYYNASTSKYGLVKLEERFGGVLLPLQEVVSIAEETKRKKMTAYFTSVLLERISTALENKEQIILFQNRRGYATILICATCGYAPKCVNCDVSLTFHKTSGKLHCHYCGYHQNSITTCPACGSVHIEQKGFGTERIEEELSLIFPEVKIARLDLDSTRTKNGMQQLIADFQDKKTQILIGTQMVAKGLDFDNVSLIGVINADTLLNYPDFRAFERSYQLLAQVAGRAGRRDKQGLSIIQAYSDSHRIIKQVLDNNYLEMYADELLEREKYNYPPFTRLIFINVKHKDANVLNIAAQNLANALRVQLGNRILGPEQPLVARIRNYYLKQISIKIEKTIAVQKVKSILKDTIKAFNTQKEFKSVIVQIDVDPY
ncbi:MAG: primosomal protein N' [Chitinophagaceae bacterium]|nr:MAG: primosomal protein N' [Chitinophagaceae bacterium]